MSVAATTAFAKPQDDLPRYLRAKPFRYGYPHSHFSAVGHAIWAMELFDQRRLSVELEDPENHRLRKRTTRKQREAVD